MTSARNTVQKNMVLNTVIHMNNHPTAEMVCKKVQENFPTISRATVYRNLNMLAEKNIIMRVAIPNGADRFDFNAKHHYHIRCLNCGEVRDAKLSYRSEWNRKMEKLSGVEITAHHIVFDGICPVCKKQENAERELIEGHEGRE